MLWEVEGNPVSMAAYSGPTPNGMRVGTVYTPNEFRKSGYASACVAGVSQLLLDRDVQFCYLFTDADNQSTNRIYQAIGFRPVSEVIQYVFIDRNPSSWKQDRWIWDTPRGLIAGDQ